MMMHVVSAVIFIGALFSTAVTVSAADLSQVEKDLLLRECEEIIKERLVSPQTYTFVSSGEERTRAATLDEYLGWYNQGHKERALELASRNEMYADHVRKREYVFARRSFDLISIEITYSHESRPGERRTSNALCSVTIPAEADIETLGPLRLLGPVVDGVSSSDWLEEHPKG
jgi:hypothetical protein